jgi:segregation and condensation protein B
MQQDPDAGQDPQAPGPDEESEALHVSRPPAQAPHAREQHAGVADHAPPRADHAPPRADFAAPAPEVEPDAEGADEPQAAPAHLCSVLESLFFAADKPLTLERLGELLAPAPRQQIQEALAALQAAGQQADRGIQLHEVAGGYQLRTSPQNAEFVQRLLQQKPVRLTRAQLETLAILAYRQPITRPEIDDIRGVDSGATLKMLLERRLIRVLGKKEEPGRPLLYGTTREFLEFFNLRDLKDLPTLREFYELSEEHQAQVNAMSSPLDDQEGQGAGQQKNAPPEPPPPLTRVELKDLDLGDDEEELARIDEMIGAVEIPLAEEVLAQAGVTVAPQPTQASSTGPGPAQADDDRPPEEL